MAAYHANRTTKRLQLRDQSGQPDTTIGMLQQGLVPPHSLTVTTAENADRETTTVHQNAINNQILEPARHPLVAIATELASTSKSDHRHQPHQCSGRDID